jgi:uncharacterized protein (DUF58 family)
LQDAEDAALTSFSAKELSKEYSVRVTIEGEIMPKARPVSLHPLNFEEAIKALINVNPDRVGLSKTRRKRKRPKRQKSKSN